MKKTIRLTESDLIRLVKRIIQEQSINQDTDIANQDLSSALSNLTGIPSNLLKKGMDRYGTEQTSQSDVYSAILGYLVEHGDSMYKDLTIDSLNTLGSQKEVRHFCEAKRDNKTANTLSKPAQTLFNTISKMVMESPNISDYIEIGRTVKSNDYF